MVPAGQGKQIVESGVNPPMSAQLVQTDAPDGDAFPIPQATQADDDVLPIKRL